MGEDHDRYVGWVGDATGMKVAIVAARWHEAYMEGMLAGAKLALSEYGVTAPEVIRVPGAFELPVVCARVVRKEYDALVALGIILKGGTPHFEYVAQSVTQGLSRVSTSSGIPIGFGVLTCENEMQARDRSGVHGSRESKGYEAGITALATATVLREWDLHPHS
ncbi:6,7-dimethyl-8-ribityllumazine synthase [Austwickia sp. TVS 96-490-7B]|uniref:6,7-dimethyl-8-ribityllumazine synthase n=1 Tax=Austwickia sp. TVS 96-490-7B TaxID=2830843 RepID=UPI001C5A0B1E|nr:6,7-dimethyl-8-ribityllumazine synthase [Austwickia sp. TVS 96-490-7B]MBW3086057.1 6,7-dimethyl-8-ribityllumazine synthase [Austwickia sp. TVS 96-490-7B]